MTIENRIRKTLASRLKLHVTRRVRGPFVSVGFDGNITEHMTKKGALNHLLIEARCMETMRWSVRPKTAGYK